MLVLLSVTPLPSSSPLVNAVAAPSGMDPFLVPTIVSSAAAVCSFIYAFIQDRRRERAERERDEDRRLAVRPALVIETEPDRMMIPGQVGGLPKLTILAFKPGPDGLANGAVLGKPTPSAQVGAAMSTEHGGPKPPHVNLVILNVGHTTAVSLQVPLIFRYTLPFIGLKQSSDASGFGVRGEKKIITLDLPLISKLEPRPADGAHICIWNESGLDVTIESAGEATDVDPQRGVSRTIVASSPATIKLQSR
jgi:hypothetical protein